jgi:molybdenum cofactor cytidylyltransferase
MISAVLLAAGESRRMGQFKQLLQLGEKSFVEHCVENLLASQVDEIIVVTGHRESDVRAAVGTRAVRLVFNNDYRSGMSSSIKCGVRAVLDISTACLIALVDQPQIGPGIVDQLIDVYENAHPRIVIPTFCGKGGHPIILDLSLKQEILEMDQSVGLRQVISAHSSEVARVEVSNREVVEDCDLPEDYERVKNR